MRRRPLRSTLFPYTTLFRSISDLKAVENGTDSLGVGGFQVIRHEDRAHKRIRGCQTAPCRTTWKPPTPRDRKSTRLNSSHVEISYAVFCLKKKKQNTIDVDL